jgi:hypothetical protein
MTNHTNHPHANTAAARAACRRNSIPRLERVDIEPEPEGSDFAGGFVVRPIFSGVDHPEGVGYLLMNKRLIPRLVHAFESGKAILNLRRGIDVNDQTYAAYDCPITAKRCNADLTRLGF